LQLVIRALDVVKAIAVADEPLSVTSLSHDLGIPAPSVHRLLTVLADQGFVRKDEASRRYFPGPELVSLLLGNRTSHLAEIARPTLERLHRQFNETVFISRLVDDHVECLIGIESTRPLRLSVKVGDTFPWHASASARAILARLAPSQISRILSTYPLVRFTDKTPTTIAGVESHIETVCKQGVDVCDDEFESQAWAVAAPLLNGEGVVGSITLSAPGQRLSTAAARHAASDAIRDAGRRLSEQLS